MKRVLRVWALALVLITALIAVASCSHQHKYAAEWSKDATHHWKAATCRHKEEKGMLAQHTLDGGKEVNGETMYTCTTCAYTVTASAFADTPISVSLAKSFAPVGVTALVEGYYAGVADTAGGEAREILLKDTATDALIGLTNIPESFGAWPELGYKHGDLLQIYGIVSESAYDASVTGSQNKRSLSFSRRNHNGLESTIISRGNTVSYALADAVTITSQEDMEALFKMDSLPAYTYVHFKGRVFQSYTSSSDDVVLYRPHMNESATAVKDIRPDGTRVVGLRKNTLTANVGTAWNDYFHEKWTNYSVAASVGYFTEADFYAVYTGADKSTFYLTVADTSWLRPAADTITIESNQDVLMEMANAYLRKRSLLEYDQYNGRRMVFATPEDASAQSYVFLDCSSYVTSVYYNAFGIKAIPDSYGSQNTKNYTKYARENHGKADYPDVVGYWETLDYDTKLSQYEVLAEVSELLQPGDILVYRRGSKTYGADYNESDLTGHAMMYMGNGLFSHSTGTSYNGGGTEAKYLYKDNPELGGDRETSEEYYHGTVQWLSAATVLDRGEGGRMLFGDKSTFVYNFSILRPLARKDANPTPTEQAQKRMAMAGLSFEKISSAGIQSAVLCGEEITYTLTVKNHASNVYRGLAFSETMDGVTLVSASIPLSQSGNVISGTFDIGAYETKEIVWTVKVKESASAGAVLCSQTTVGGLKMKSIENTVSALTAAELSSIAAKAREYAENGASFADPMELVRLVYTEALGRDPFEGKSTAEMLEALFEFTAANKAVIRTDGAFIDMVARNLYGGSDLYSSTYTNNNSIVRTVYEHNLTVGDVILCEWYEKTRVYIYLGDGAFASIDSETLTCALKENGSEAWVKDGNNYYQRHLMASLFAYQRYVVLRPR